MNFRWLIFCGSFLCSNYLLSQEAEDIVKKLELKSPDVNKEVNGSCLTCKGSADEGKYEDPFCKNLYSAICVGDGEKSKYEGSFDNESDVLENVLREGRDKAAKAMGFNSFKDYIGNALKKTGIELTSEFNDNNMSELFYDSKKTVGTFVFKEVEGCENTSNNQANSETQNEEALELYNSKLVEAYSLNLVNFIESYSDSCNFLKYYPKEENKKLIEMCGKFNKVRSEAVDLYRIEGTPEYKEKALDFIKKNLLPVAKYYASDSKSTEVKNALRDTCNKMKKVFLANSRKIAIDLAAEVAKSKPVVEHMIDYYYTTQRNSNVLKIFDDVKTSIKATIPQITQDEKKRAILEKGYDNLQLAWLKKPDSSSYKKDDKSGLDILILGLDSGELDYAFGDWNLSYFTQINAFYTPIAWDEGESAVDTVHMMPFFLKASDENKYDFIAVLAHEAAHKIGPELSYYNKHDLRKEWAKLIDCYRQKDSIKLMPGQEDETIADYISSEILAKYLNTYPIEERRKVFALGMHDFCLFDDNANKNYIYDMKEEHPDSILRINGIYGANPSVKKALGCNENSYRECRL